MINNTNYPLPLISFLAITWLDFRTVYLHHFYKCKTNGMWIWAGLVSRYLALSLSICTHPKQSTIPTFSSLIPQSFIAARRNFLARLCDTWLTWTQNFWTLFYLCMRIKNDGMNLERWKYIRERSNFCGRSWVSAKLKWSVCLFQLCMNECSP